MPDIQSKKIAWPRLGADAITIIVSILLAFAEEEWREESRDRDLEREYLTRLVEDLDANVAEADLQGSCDEYVAALPKRAMFPGKSGCVRCGGIVAEVGCQPLFCFAKRHAFAFGK